MSAHQFEHRYSALRRLVDRDMTSIIIENQPREFHKATRYVLSMPGKRVRATILLLACAAVGGNIRFALPAATAIEMLHNFTLVHDDVMDNAPFRRGHATVHTKWDVNSAILVGDLILGLAYRQLLTRAFADTKRIVQLLTDGFVEVCKGQALDIEFETRTNITLGEYYKMIDKKTGKLIATAAEMGGMIGNGNPAEVRALKKFGLHIGRAFQIQDDLLDVIAKEKSLGKRIGGDIVTGKKTFLLITAIRRARGRDRVFLRSLSREKNHPEQHKRESALIMRATALYQKYASVEEAHQQIQRESTAGLRALRKLPPTRDRAMLEWFGQSLMQRAF
jgi:geranylgeranyl diphosphate synthase, type II